ncbi:alpha/beta hydrolase [Streptomyces sp. NPDC049906]|uniref:alpha/beta hydrolase n=1 Tax=Streptomyces sp. NPDC049906 TaxID=3155656 RepID=UPI003412B9F4
MAEPSDQVGPDAPPAAGVRTHLRTPDGLWLAGTLTPAVVSPPDTARAALFLHAEGATREQGGLYAQVAQALATAGVTGLRFDLPGHGVSEGRQAELSLSGLLNVIGAGSRLLRERIGATRIHLLAAGLTGGVAAGYAARRGAEIERLVLFDPLIDYKERFVDGSGAWRDGYLDEVSGRELVADGRVRYSPGLTLGRAMLNEVFWLQPRGVLGAITAPTLVVHGTGASCVPLRSSRTAVEALSVARRLLDLTGATGSARTTAAARAAVEWLLGADPGRSAER